MNYFNQWSSLPNPEKWQNHWSIEQKAPRKQLIEALNKKCKTILNVGCGVAADRNLYTAEYYGVDVTPKFTVEAHRSGADVQASSILNLPFKDGAFDGVCCENLLVHLPPECLWAALDEMFRVASCVVAFNEPAWTKETCFQIKERYFTGDGVVAFYLNSYGASEMIAYFKNKGVKSHEVWVDRSRAWQVTVLNKT